jgi:hypothetical protein
VARQEVIRVDVVCGNALDVDADVLVLKYAQGLYGVDRLVARALLDVGIDEPFPLDGDFSVLETMGAIGSRQAIFVGVKPLNQFGYRDIRQFAFRAVSALAGAAPHAQRIAFTIHGTGYGLDEDECFSAELAGISDAIALGECPEALTTVTFIEQSRDVAARLAELLSTRLPGKAIDRDSYVFAERLGEQRSEELRAVGYDSNQKPYVFVAMPFELDMNDTFHFGIRRAASTNGLLCERVDQEAFTGDILNQVKTRIKSASFVVADLTGGNPNVYLEVGYAWGCRVPTILVIKASMKDTLRFDVQGQRCLIYNDIRALESALTKELNSLTGLQA